MLPKIKLSIISFSFDEGTPQSRASQTDPSQDTISKEVSSRANTSKRLGETSFLYPTIPYLALLPAADRG